MRMSKEIMDSTNSETSAANHVYGTLQDKALRLKPLLKDILEDYDNPACDFILRRCKNVIDLESFLKAYSHLFIVENEKVAKYCEHLEAGQEAADRYFEEKLKEYKHPVSIEKLRICVENAPVNIQQFIKTFYPETEFKRYLLKRPHIFYVSDGNVDLITKECAEFFRNIVKQGEGINFMSLRGNIAQAPEHIRKYINNWYPGTEFSFFLENNCDIFRLDSNRRVFLVK